MTSDLSSSVLRALTRGPFSEKTSIEYQFPHDPPIRAHRALIHCRSNPQFRSQFLPETASVKVSLPHPIFQAIIHFFYSDALPEKALLQPLFKLSSELGMHTLAEKCVAVLGGGRGAFDLGNLEQDLKRMFKSNLFSDITLVVEDQPIKAHKFILVNRSPYFEAMFSTSWSEAELEEVALPGVELEVFERVILFLYTQETETPEELLFGVTFQADMFGVEQLKLACFDQIRKKLCKNFKTSPECTNNVAQVLDLAITLNFQPLIDEASRYILSHSSVWSTKEFHSLAESFSDQLFEKAQEMFNSKNSLSSFGLLQKSLVSQLKTSPKGGPVIELLRKINQHCLDVLFKNFRELVQSPELEKWLQPESWESDLAVEIFQALEKSTTENNVCQRLKELLSSLDPKKPPSIGDETEAPFEGDLEELSLRPSFKGYQKFCERFIQKRFFNFQDDPEFQGLPEDVRQRISSALGLSIDQPQTPRRVSSKTPLKTHHLTHGQQPANRAPSSSSSSPSSSSSSPSSSSTPITFRVGSRVACQRGKGVIRFAGKTSFSQGIWYGIELDDTVGLNDGSVQGVRYFQTSERRGVFLQEKNLQAL